MNKNLGIYEDVGLCLEFYEKRILNEKKSVVCIKAEYGSLGIYISDEWTFSSVKNLKLKYPTLRDLLILMFKSTHWTVFNNSNNERRRLLYVKSIKGNDGIYTDLDSVAYNDEIE